MSYQVARSSARVFLSLVFGAAFLSVFSPTALAAPPKDFSVISGSVYSPTSMEAGSRGPLNVKLGFDSPTISDDISGFTRRTVRDFQVTLPRGLTMNFNRPERCDVRQFYSGSCSRAAQIGEASMDVKYSVRNSAALAVIAAYTAACVATRYPEVCIASASSVISGLLGSWFDQTMNGKIYSVDATPNHIGEVGVELPFEIGGLQLDTLRFTVGVDVDVQRDHRFRLATVDSIPNGLIKDVLGNAGAALAVQGLEFRFGSGSTPGAVELEPTLPTFCDPLPSYDIAATAHNDTSSEMRGGTPTTGCRTIETEKSEMAIAPRSTINTTSTPYPYTFTTETPWLSGRSHSAIAGIKAMLPNGFRLSPGLNLNMSTCEPGQFNLANQDIPARCPKESRIGYSEISMRELNRVHSDGSKIPLFGGIYLGEVKTVPDAQGKPERLNAELYLELKNDRMRYKTLGYLSTAKNGELVVIFGRDGDQVGGLPELIAFPWERLKLYFETPSSRGIFANTFCGVNQSAKADFTPWSESLFPVGVTKVYTQPNISSDSLWYDGSGKCPVPEFKPTFSAKLDNDQAGGASNSLEFQILRSAYEQNLSGFKLQLPAGITMTSPGVRCARSMAKKDPENCPPGTVVGSVKTEVGFGGETISIPGKIITVDPTSGALVDFILVLDGDLPAFNLGNIALESHLENVGGRYEIRVDQGGIHELVAGVPLPIRTFDFKLSPGTITNPSSCMPAGGWQFDATFLSTTMPASSHTQSFSMTCQP